MVTHLVDFCICSCQIRGEESGYVGGIIRKSGVPFSTCNKQVHVSDLPRDDQLHARQVYDRLENCNLYWYALHAYIPKIEIIQLKNTNAISQY